MYQVFYRRPDTGQALFMLVSAQDVASAEQQAYARRSGIRITRTLPYSPAL